MRTVLLTSDNLRHKYIAVSLAIGTDLRLVVAEEKAPAITDTSNENEEDAAFLQDHFAARAASENAFFGSNQNFPEGIPLLRQKHGDINSEEVYERVKKEAPDVIVLFGTSIIKNPLLKEFEGRTINLHLGLSPYYQGSATNLYPYLFREPECVGATIHLATPEVDKGAILYQLRPNMSTLDDLHTIGSKVILDAGKILPKVLEKYVAGKVTPVRSSGDGRLCRNRDITPEALRKIYRNFEEGMIGKYLAEKENRDGRKPIVDQF